MKAISSRHAFRAGWHDYGCGIYFVTICCRDRKSLFGNIEGNSMQLSPIGEMVEYCLMQIPVYHPAATIRNHVIMPNHLHMVISVGRVLQNLLSN